VIDTRYLYLLINFNVPSLSIYLSTSFSTSRFFVESGCKSTTFFQTDKNFFQLFFQKHQKTLKIRIRKFDFFSKETRN